MIVGIPRERFVDERRVALAPSGVHELVQLGATVYVEKDAGFAAGWNDSDYEEAGATIAFQEEEVFQRADLLLKILPPTVEETQHIREEQIIMSYLQLPLAHPDVFKFMRERGITAIGLENIYYEGGGHPVRRAMSEIAGKLAIHSAAHYLGAHRGGRGVLMGGVPGVPPASVGILGAGVAGSAAAEAALNMGAHVIMLDHKVAPLRQAMRHFSNKGLQTAVITERSIEKVCTFVDAMIAAILIEDVPTPHLVTRDMVRTMKKRSVIVDIGIDQGGTFETSRPTTLSSPTYYEEGVIHYCVPNMPAAVPRTATRAFQNQVMPLLRSIVPNGIRNALLNHHYLSSGLNLYLGTVTRETVANTFKSDWSPINEVLR